MSVRVPSVRIECGDALAVLRTLVSGSANCCVTSPPYWGLRDYGCEGQIGLEPTPEEYVARLVAVFAEVRRVLRNDGTLWLNLGDGYAAQGGSQDAETKGGNIGKHVAGALPTTKHSRRAPGGLKPKDLIGTPWRVAFALQADGWWLRSDIVWHKIAPMPESVTDRPTRSHEYVFLLTKSARYWYDADAIREPIKAESHARATYGFRESSRDAHGHHGKGFMHDGGAAVVFNEMGRNARDVWSLGPDPFPGAHFAVMPETLAERCILAGCPEGGTVLDPFGGSGTVGAVAARHGRDAILCELNPDYCDMARRRVLPDAQPRLDIASLDPAKEGA